MSDEAPAYVPAAAEINARDHAWRVDASVRAIPNLMDRSDPKGVTFPGFAARAKGSHIWSIAGTRYLDFILHFGCIILGHADDTVDEAVIAQIRRGISPTLRSPRHIELAELLRSVIPNAESALFLRTGSDATTAAVRLSRAYTGKNHVVRWGYHGWHDWGAPRSTGIPPAYRSLATTFDYNDLESLERELAEHEDDLACLIMMPYEVEIPREGFLAACRDLAHHHSALFVLDEVRSGFRLSLGGAQEFFGIDADLVAFSKSMGNGYPISAVTGRQEVLAIAERVSHTSSFFRSADGAAAAIATIRALIERDALARVWDLGSAFMEGLALASSEEGVDAEPVGLPPMPYHSFGLEPEAELAAQRRFCHAALAAGVLFHPTHHWFICDAMTEEDIEHALLAARTGYRAVRLLDERS